MIVSVKNMTQAIRYLSYSYWRNSRKHGLGHRMGVGARSVLEFNAAQ